MLTTDNSRGRKSSRSQLPHWCKSNLTCLWLQITFSLTTITMYRRMASLVWHTEPLLIICRSSRRSYSSQEQLIQMYRTRLVKLRLDYYNTVALGDDICRRGPPHCFWQLTIMASKWLRCYFNMELIPAYLKRWAQVSMFFTNVNLLLYQAKAAQGNHCGVIKLLLQYRANADVMY
jgi:hypothetical protein